MNRNKRKIIIVGVCVTLVLLVVGYLALNYVSLTIQFGKGVVAVDVYKQGVSQKVSSLSSSGVVVLQKGGYSLHPVGDTVDTAPINITVNSSGLVTVSPGLSPEKLTALANSQASAVSAAITSRFSNSLSRYAVKNVTFFNYGEWVGALIVSTDKSSRDVLDYYRILLSVRDASGSYVVAGDPQFTLTQPDYPGVPRNILQSVNSIEPTW